MKEKIVFVLYVKQITFEFTMLNNFFCFYWYSFMTNLERIAGPDYIPTDQDVLRVRVPTTGINDYSFSVEKITLR